jgi:hypothetical protein
MSFLNELKAGPKLTGAVKVKLPPKPSGTQPAKKWEILNNKNLFENITKRIKEYIMADNLGKLQRNSAFNTMLTKLKSNKYNKIHRQLLIGGLSERKNQPFVKKMLNKFNSTEIQNAINVFENMKKKGKGVHLPPPPPPPPPIAFKPNAKKPTPKPVSKTKTKKSPKKPAKISSKSDSNNDEFFTPKSSYVHNSSTALNTVEKLLKTQKPNDILKVHLLFAGKKMKKISYSRT